MSNKQRTANIKRTRTRGNKEVQKNTIFYFFSLASTGEGISGGDRIYIELSRRWSNKHPVNIFTTNEGVQMMDRQKLEGKKLEVISIADNLPENFLIKFIYKTFAGLKLGLSLDLSENSGEVYLYSSSEFWMDVFPAVLLKIRFPKTHWIATWYQTAPNPLRGFNEQRTINNKHKSKNSKQRNRSDKHFMTALLYWLVQLPVKPLIKLFADKVIVNNEEERKQFPDMEKKGDVIVLIGAVPLSDIKNFLSQQSKTNNRKPIYSAVFQGRFHAQKGVVELIDIWKKVVAKIPQAKLAMVGDGDLMSKVKTQISKLKLEDNVELFGYVFDGPKKYKIFSNSKLVVHPAYYDSGGMATAEAMAFGIPAIGFDLKAYDSYYPKGMVKVKNEKEFSKKIVELLKDDKQRKKIGKEAESLIKSNYSWDNRAEEIISNILKN